MNDDRVTNGTGSGTPLRRADRVLAGDALAADLRALRARSARVLPTLNDTALALSMERPRVTWGGSLVSMFRFLKSRPVFSSAALVGLVAAALLVIPVSYQRTVGHDVSLTLSGYGLDPSFLQRVAKEYAAALDGEGVRIAIEETDDITGRPTRRATLTTSVAARSRGTVEGVAQAFAAALHDRGLDAAVAVAPRTEHVSGNVYAAAGNACINLSIDRRGKTADEIRASITAQLEAAGIRNPDVNVTLDGNLTTVKIQADNACGDGGAAQCEIRLKVDGEGAEEAHPVSIHCDPNATCDEMEARIREELRARGVDADVTVTGSECSHGQPCTGACQVEVKVERRK
jgi:hypothetical protein